MKSDEEYLLPCHSIHKYKVYSMYTINSNIESWILSRSWLAIFINRPKYSWIQLGSFSNMDWLSSTKECKTIDIYGIALSIKRMSPVETVRTLSLQFYLKHKLDTQTIKIIKPVILKKKIWLGYLEEGRACIPVGHET